MEDEIKGAGLQSPKSTHALSPSGSVNVEDYEIRIKTLAPKVDAEATRNYTWMQKVNCLFDPMAPQPNQHYARAAVGISAFIYALIFLSVAVFVVESLPQYQGDNTPFYIIEVVCISFFTFELTARMITCPSGKVFAKDPYNWIDIFAVLPFYIDFVLSTGFGMRQGVSLVFLRVIRLARVFRMLKLGQFSKPLQMVVLVLAHSVDALFLLVFLLFISTILFSSLLYVYLHFFLCYSFFLLPLCWETIL
eukprot:TRINITY_DN19268_c0_g1_i2.p1 TRINITY_DN19268_c0_g1~~TRINITY_DN19268_c0_g1_i2.p1  ORF type:complete len:249 (+),score=19.28 TRINITY_DN19268_c0_g1_i2:79-825(+)